MDMYVNGYTFYFVSFLIFQLKTSYTAMEIVIVGRHVFCHYMLQYYFPICFVFVDVAI